MATLQVRDIDDRLYNLLKSSAKRQNRSISQEVVTILENHLNTSVNIKNSTLEFLSLTGAWKEENTAEAIVKDVRMSRKQSNRFGANNGIFD